jgi:hypothetical protein
MGKRDRLGHGYGTSCDGAMVWRHIELGRSPYMLGRQGAVIPAYAEGERKYGGSALREGRCADSPWVDGPNSMLLR